jgi:predicted hydrolase (HD superfamily)
MRFLAKHFGEDENKWEIVGLLHDGDYEFTKEDLGRHAKLMADWVRELGETDEELLTGIESHGWFHEGKLPKTKMQWALYCCDELTGLIVAVALVRPSKKLADVTVENILDKWNSKSFAAGVKREDIEYCEKELEIPLKDFIGIALKAMQGISSELGL